MTALFDARDSGNRARRLGAPGPPATYGETLLSIFEDNSANAFSTSENQILRNEYERYLDDIETETGQSFENPFNTPSGPQEFTRDIPNPALQRFLDYNPALAFQPPTRSKTKEERERELFDELILLKRDRFPDLPIKTPKEFRKNLVEFSETAAGRRTEVAARETTLAQQGFAFLANVGTMMLDPPILASMAFGAPAASGILRAALIDAGIGVAVEVPIQAVVQARRARLGQETSLSEAALNVLTVGAGGLIFSGLVRGGVKGTRAVVRTVREKGLARTRKERDALAFLERQTDLEDATPFDRDRPGARAASTRRACPRPNSQCARGDRRARKSRARRSGAS